MFQLLVSVALADYGITQSYSLYNVHPLCLFLGLSYGKKMMCSLNKTDNVYKKKKEKQEKKISCKFACDGLCVCEGVCMHGSTHVCMCE